MKYCIISDLHCKYSMDTSITTESLLLSNMPRRPVTQHPVAAMLKLIEDQQLNADFLLCLGDLGDRADEQGITSAWNFVEEIRLKIGAQIKLGVPGNHDINSRKNNGKTAFGFIEKFHETFPTAKSSLNSKFWGTGYCIEIHSDVLFLLVNTVHDHIDELSANSSNMLKSTFEEIEEEIKLLDNGKLKNKICMLHHHPIKHSNIHNYKDGDSIDRGDHLVEMLNKHDFSIILHGHKHLPRISDYNGIPILAAGSFSSFANLQSTGFSTMFHIIEFENNKQGTISSWEYNVQSGWETNMNKFFPSKIGFGEEIDIKETAKKIGEFMLRDNIPKPYEEILKIIPQLKFTVPDKLYKIGKILKKEYNLSLRPEFPLTPILITPL